jgi:hypothetical protein
MYRERGKSWTLIAESEPGFFTYERAVIAARVLDAVDQLN